MNPLKVLANQLKHEKEILANSLLRITQIAEEEPVIELAIEALKEANAGGIN